MARRTSSTRKAVVTVAAWTFGILISFPILWTIMMSFKSEADAVKAPFAMIASPWSFESYAEVQERSNYARHFMNSVVMVGVGGKDVRTLPKDVSFHPVTDRPLHVDFLRISEHAKVTVNVPVHFINELAAPGIKRGGVLNVVRHELELVCDAAEIPDEIAVDLTGFEVGDSIHISAVTLPKGVTSVISDRDYTIATIVAPSALKSSEGDSDDAPAESEEAAS